MPPLLLGHVKTETERSNTTPRILIEKTHTAFYLVAVRTKSTKLSAIIGLVRIDCGRYTDRSRSALLLRDCGSRWCTILEGQLQDQKQQRKL